MNRPLTTNRDRDRENMLTLQLRSTTVVLPLKHLDSADQLLPLRVPKPQAPVSAERHQDRRANLPAGQRRHESDCPGRVERVSLGRLARAAKLPEAGQDGQKRRGLGDGHGATLAAAVEDGDDDGAAAVGDGEDGLAGGAAVR